MISFLNDYSEGAHERIMEALLATNRTQTVGYGMDEFCNAARKHIGRHFHRDSTSIHFLVGGTQTNLTVIASLLKPYQGVIAADSGHVATHETGAIEATGHKVLTLPARNGKINAEQVKALIQAHYSDETMEHTVQPGMVYISQPTELGTIYSYDEMAALREVCRLFQIPLYVDGARLATALTCDENDIKLGDLEDLADVFYIGGTKMGALFGEALVICNPRYNVCFRYMIKQRGGLLAKGRLIGIQFLELFKDELYFELGLHAVNMAKKLQDGIRALGYSFGVNSPTNQIFPIFPVDVLAAIHEKYLVSTWCAVDSTHVQIRMVTSWATEEKSVDSFLADLKEITEKRQIS